MNFRAFVALASGVLLVACVSIQGLYHDPSFTYAAIQENSIGVGGVVSSAKALTPASQNNYANILRNSFVERYTGVDIMPSGDVVRALSAPRYQSMMHYYQRYGVIQSYYLKAMQQHIHHMRYVAFARITEDTVSHSRQEEGSMQKGMTDIHFRTNLNMRVDLAVYDLSQNRVVWSGTISDGGSQSNTYTVPTMSVSNKKDLNKQIVQDVASYAMQQQVSKNHSYPAAPSRLGLLSSIFKGLVNKFPEAPSN